MDWLVQNWFWIVAGIAILFVMRRHAFGHIHGGRGRGGLADHHDRHGGDSERTRSAADMGGRPAGAPSAAIDPVSGNAVRTDEALSSVHAGRVFYFESADTRQRFEAEPEGYAANSHGSSQVPDNGGPDDNARYRRRSGC